MPTKTKSLFGALSVGLVTLLLQPVVFAGSYDALCGGVNCTVVLDTKGFTGPSGFIPSHRIAQWYTGGGEEVNGAVSAAGATGGALGGVLVGALATCWTIILCPLGLIGGGVAGGMGGARAGRSADFYFTIVGYNQDGKKTMQSFNFINKKPASKMIQELPLVSGLGMGETRTVDEIKAGDTRLIEKGSAQSDLPTNINAVPVKGGYGKSLPDSLGSISAQEAAPSGQSKCWSIYLSQNPNIKKWVDANPAAGKNLQKKYDQC